MLPPKRRVKAFRHRSLNSCIHVDMVQLREIRPSAMRPPVLCKVGNEIIIAVPWVGLTWFRQRGRRSFECAACRSFHSMSFPKTVKPRVQQYLACHHCFVMSKGGTFSRSCTHPSRVRIRTPAASGLRCTFQAWDVRFECASNGQESMVISVVHPGWWRPYIEMHWVHRT